MRINSYFKIFFYSSVTVLVLLIISIAKIKSLKERSVGNKILVIRKLSEDTDNVNKSLKYILLWTSRDDVPFVYMGKGRKGFIERKCPVTNCFVTGNRNYLDDYTKFDAIAFNGPHVRKYSKKHLPQKRSSFQKYIFASIESAHNYPVCSEDFDNFFNWTWTYKLNSDARWGYMVVRDKKGKIIGPNEVMHWIDIDHMDDVKDNVREKIKTKSIAAAWFVSNCYTNSERLQFATKIHSELIKYGLTLHIYGKCGNHNCSSDEMYKCRELIQKKYYFYFAFENSFSEDYVTEKVLHGLQNYAVPVVYGRANYTRSVTALVLFTITIANIIHLKRSIGNNAYNKSWKYILLWTSPHDVPFFYMGEGRKGLIDRKCPVTNCFVTGNRNYLNDYTQFDAIAFNGDSKKYLPQRRSSFQKYIFASTESAHNYPVCREDFDNFFNWTWTYKLNSDARWGYMVVRDKNGNIIGPNEVMQWIDIDHMDDIKDNVREKLKTKSVAAAWFVSNCDSISLREKMASKIHSELMQYGLTLHIYGKCGNLSCSKNKMYKCLELIQKKYYFYFAFENSFSEDYVTEKLLHGLQNYAVPVVYGRANYTRFMPDGIYLNALELGPQKVAATMNELIKNPKKYEKYFRWHNHYSFHGKQESIETNEYCIFCEILNNKTLTNKTTIYEHFRRWWNPRGFVCPAGPL